MTNDREGDDDLGDGALGARKSSSPRRAGKRALFVSAWIVFVLLEVEFSFGFFNLIGTGLPCGVIVFSFIYIVSACRLRAGDGRRRHVMRGVLIFVMCIFGMMTTGLIGGFQEAASMKRAEPIISALSRYRTVHGDYPSELPTLAPTYIAEIPHSRMGLTGKEYGYRRWNDDGEPPEYSLWFDGHFGLRAIYMSGAGDWTMCD